MSTLRTVKKDPEFNYKLLKIAKEITHDVLEDMKFVCDLPSGERESINEPREFLSILYKRGKIIPGDVTYLVSLLENTDNGRLASAVMEELGKIRLYQTTIYTVLANDLEHASIKYEPHWRPLEYSHCCLSFLYKVI